MNIAFDIETMPNTKALGDKINSTDEKDIKTVAEAGISPIYGRVCSYVLMSVDGTTPISKTGKPVCRVCISEETDEQEKVIVQWFFDFIFNKLHFNDTLVTFNGINFDIPFMYKRALILGVDFKKYTTMRTLNDYVGSEYYAKAFHIDVFSRWSMHRYGGGNGLNELSNAFYNMHKIDIDFHLFPELIKTEEGREQIMTYCEQDVALTALLYNSMVGVLF